MALCLIGKGSAQSKADSRQDFHIDAQPLSSALPLYARIAGVDLLYGAKTPATSSSSKVDGTMSASEALRRLLSGTGLAFRFTGPHTVQLEVAQAKQPGVAQLGPLQVQGTTDRGGYFGDVGEGGNRDLNQAAKERPYTTPASTSFISREQIDRVPPTVVGDIFKNVPGVIAAGSHNSSGLNINIRGLQGMNRVNVLVDGTQQSSSQYIGYHGSTSSVYIDQDFISGVDIAKGPNGGQFGSGVTGGVVNMRTIDATDIVREGHSFGVQIKGGLATGTREPDLGVNFIRSGRPGGFSGDALRGSIALGWITEHVNTMVGVSRRKTGNYFAGSRINGSTNPYSVIGRGDEALNTSQDTLSEVVKVQSHFGDGQTLELSYMNYYDKHGYLDEFFLIYGTLPTIQGQLAITKANTYSARYGYHPSNSSWVNLRANIWGTRTNTDRILSPITSVGTEIWNSSEQRTSMGVFHTKYGGSFSQENMSGKNPAGKRYLGSFFSQESWRVKKWLAIDGTLRVDRFLTAGYSGGTGPLLQQSGNRVNPTVSVTVEPWQGIQFFGTYARGWRPPSLRESYWQLGTLLYPNPLLKPEASSNVEAGGNVSRSGLLFRGDSARLKASFFSNNYGNYVVRKNTAPSGPSRYTWMNLDKAVYRGVELQGSYAVPHVFAEGNFTRYTHITYCPTNEACSAGPLGEDYGGTYVPPSYTGSGTLGTRLFRDTFSGGITANFWSGRANISGPTGGYIPAASWPKSVVLNAYASYKVMNKIDFGASAENLTDRYYLDPVSITFLPSPGRIVRLNTTIRF
jgi:hemoglobin/transferrin/lactoferrin receptor protein